MLYQLWTETLNMDEILSIKQSAMKMAWREQLYVTYLTTESKGQDASCHLQDEDEDHGEIELKTQDQEIIMHAELSFGCFFSKDTKNVTWG